MVLRYSKKIWSKTMEERKDVDSIVRLCKTLRGGWVPEQDTLSYYNQSIETVE